MTYDDWKTTDPSDGPVTRSRSLPIHQCVECGAATSPQFVAIAWETYLCQACWHMRDDRRNSTPECYGDEAA